MGVFFSWHIVRHATEKNRGSTEPYTPAGKIKALWLCMRCCVCLCSDTEETKPMLFFLPLLSNPPIPSFHVLLFAIKMNCESKEEFLQDHTAWVKSRCMISHKTPLFCCSK